MGYYYDGSRNYYQIDTVEHTTAPSESYSANVITTTTLNAQNLSFSDTIQGDGTDGYYITATYSTSSNSDIVIQIYLDDSCATNWTPVYNRTANEWTFYYNYILKSRDTSEQLVDKLVLSSATAADAYVSFDYSLNITADSVQVTYNKDGKITYDAVTWDYVPSSTEFPKATTDSDVYEFDVEWKDSSNP
ncbi:MAG: hypothetical protein LUC50_02900 [Ruminococcus sp.]|nr:hypothetical protein [Ruminococcus sp.]